MPLLDLGGVSQSTQALRQLVAKVRAAGARRDDEGAGRVEAVLARRRRGARLRDGFGAARRLAWRRWAARRRRRGGGVGCRGRPRGIATGPALLSTPGGSSSASSEAAGRVHAVLRVLCS